MSRALPACMVKAVENQDQSYGEQTRLRPARTSGLLNSETWQSMSVDPTRRRAVPAAKTPTGSAMSSSPAPQTGNGHATALFRNDVHAAHHETHMHHRLGMGRRGR